MNRVEALDHIWGLSDSVDGEFNCGGDETAALKAKTQSAIDALLRRNEDPNVLHTQQQLDDLPVGAVVMTLWDDDDVHAVMQKHADGWFGFPSTTPLHPLGSGNNDETVALLWPSAPLADGPVLIPGVNCELADRDSPFHGDEPWPTLSNKIVAITKYAGVPPPVFTGNFDRALGLSGAQWHAGELPRAWIKRPGEIRYYAGYSREKLNVGVVIRHDSTCTNCRQIVAVRHVYDVVPAADMAGTIHHVDCTDPTLERSPDS